MPGALRVSIALALALLALAAGPAAAQLPEPLPDSTEERLRRLEEMNAKLLDRLERDRNEAERRYRALEDRYEDLRKRAEAPAREAGADAEAEGEPHAVDAERTARHDMDAGASQVLAECMGPRHAGRAGRPGTDDSHRGTLAQSPSHVHRLLPAQELEAAREWSDRSRHKGNAISHQDRSRQVRGSGREWFRTLARSPYIYIAATSTSA